MTYSLKQAIAAYEKAGEELANVAALAAIHRSTEITVEDGRELMDRVLAGEVFGARAERAILEAVALTTAFQVLKKKLKIEK